MGLVLRLSRATNGHGQVGFLYRTRGQIRDEVRFIRNEIVLVSMLFGVTAFECKDFPRTFRESRATKVIC